MYRTLSLATLLISTTCLADVVPGTHYALQYEGRSHKDYQAGSVKFNWPGTSLNTQFTGQKLTISLIGNGDHFDVLLNGKLDQKLLTSAGGIQESFVLVDQTENESVTIELVKRTENYQALTEVVSVEHDGYLEGVWSTQPHILFIGDSISAGFGSESNKRECTWEEVYASSNARLAFPYQTAAQLDTTFTQISFSGLGLIRNWGGNQPHHNLTDYTDKLAAIDGQSLDYQDKHPSLVIVEVGTNDFSTDPLASEPWADIEDVREAWTARMVEYVAELKQRYQTSVVLMPRPAYPYNYIIPATDEAITRLGQQGIEGVYMHTFSQPLEGCIWHPTASEHENIASHLTQFITDNKLL